MNGTELRSFSHFQIMTKVVYLDLSRNLQINLFSSLSLFTVKPRRSVQMIKPNYKSYLQVVFFAEWNRIKKF